MEVRYSDTTLFRVESILQPQNAIFGMIIAVYKRNYN